MAIDKGTWSLVKHYLKPIMHFLDDPSITEIMVNNFNTIFIKRRGEMLKTDVSFSDERSIIVAIRQVGVAIGEDVDEDKHPIVDARLWDGSRFCGVLSPWARNGSNFTIRVFPKKALTISDLLDYESLTQEMVDYLRLAVLSDSNILISGSTDSGKTTLLNALTGFIPERDRVILVEDTPEIRTELPNLISLVVYERPNESGYEKLDLAKMIKTTLRMNGSRVIVGEIRDAMAALSFMRTLNIGSNGCMASIHANDPYDAVERLTDLLGEQGKPVEYAHRQVCSNLHVIVQAAEVKGVGRKIVEIAEVSRGGETTTLFRYDYRSKEHVVMDENLANSAIREMAYGLGIS